jgi:hypothetical protein
MGYTTDFNGSFQVIDLNTGEDAVLSEEQSAYINKFSDTRRMSRVVAQTETLPDPIREAVGLPVGNEGGYFVGAGGFAGQDHSTDIISYNSPPSDQPGLWCQWVVSEADKIEWDGSEKFYHYSEWLAYIVDHFLAPWGYGLSGTVEWQGEDRQDVGIITVRNGTEVLECCGEVHATINPDSIKVINPKKALD